MWDESSELRRRLIRDDMSGGELLVIHRQRGYIFYTMRGGVKMGMMDVRAQDMTARQRISNEMIGKQ
jgi:hypothetical protein